MGHADRSVALKACVDEMVHKAAEDCGQRTSGARPVFHAVSTNDSCWKPTGMVGTMSAYFQLEPAVTSAVLDNDDTPDGTNSIVTYIDRNDDVLVSVS